MERILLTEEKALNKAEPQQQDLPKKYKRIDNFPSPHMAQAKATLHIVNPENKNRGGAISKEQLVAIRLMRSFSRMGFPFLEKVADDLLDGSVSVKAQGLEFTVKGLQAVNQTEDQKGKLQKLHDFITGQG